MLVVNGETFVQAIEVGDYLDGVTPALVRQWKRRRLITGYPTGRLVYFRVSELVEVEYVTRTAPLGRPRQGGLTNPHLMPDHALVTSMPVAEDCPPTDESPSRSPR